MVYTGSMQYFTHSEARYNRSNEDAIAVQPHPEDAGVLVCALADGQGGQLGGATASQIAVQTCIDLAGEYAVKQLCDRKTWESIIRKADEAVSGHPDAGFTTLISLCVATDRICGASCGDSAALLIRSTRYEVLTAKQRKNPPVGSHAALPASFEAQLKPDSKLVIMSDGVWQGLGHDAIADVALAKQGQELIVAVRQLQVGQNYGQLPDDFSLIIVQ